MTTPVIAQADTAAAQHQQYYDQFVRRGRQELYNVLASIYGVCLAVEKSGHKDAVIEQMRKLLRENHSIKASKKTAPIAVVIRYITRAETKTVSVYKRVLSSAMDAGISESDLPAYITANGGVDKCGKAIANNDAKREQNEFHKNLMAAATHQLSTQHPVGKVTFNSQVRPTLPRAADVAFVHGLFRSNTVTGELELVSTLYPSSAIEKMALDLQVLCCRAASIKEHALMNQFCKENDLNVDIVHRWMASNDVANADAAYEKLVELQHLIENPPRKPSGRKAA